jgi:hypothetical protein
MFWDGTRWIDPRARKPAPLRRGHLIRDWLATVLMAVALIALAFPGLPASAVSPTISLSPTSGVAGTHVTASVSGLDGGTSVQLAWDGSTTGMPAGTASRQGDVRLRFKVPASGPGVHEIAVMSTVPPQGRSRATTALPSGIVLAIAAFSVGLPPAGPSAAAATPIASASSVATSTPASSDVVTANPAATGVATPVPGTPAATTVPLGPTPAPAPLPTGCTRLATMDATGASNVTAALQSFINASPNGSTICLAAGGQYRVDGSISIDGRTGITIDGQGARIFGTVRSNSPKLSFGLGSGLTLRHITIEGFHPEAGTSNAYLPAWEHGHAIAIYGSRQVTIGPNVTLRNVSGDGIYITGSSTSGGGFQWADGVTVSGCRIERNGRMGVALTDGARNVVVSGCVLDQIALYGFDLEPNGVVKNGVLAGAENVRFSNNSIGRYGLDHDYTPLLFAGTGNGDQRNIEFSGNVVSGGPLLIGVWNVAGSERLDFRILNNRSSTRVAGPTMDFAGVVGLTVTGNTQPLSSGSLTKVTSCSSVTISNNGTG